MERKYHWLEGWTGVFSSYTIRLNLFSMKREFKKLLIQSLTILAWRMKNLHWLLANIGHFTTLLFVKLRQESFAFFKHYFECKSRCFLQKIPSVLAYVRDSEKWDLVSGICDSLSFPLVTMPETPCMTLRKNFGVILLRLPRHSLLWVNSTATG